MTSYDFTEEGLEVTADGEEGEYQVTPGVSYEGVDLASLPPATWEWVTPEAAHTNLQSMRENQRPLRERDVSKILRDILNGDWHATGETVQQGDDGLWDNGQHRFTAIYQSGVTVPMLVVRGINKQARLVLDSGIPRRYSDTLKMDGLGNAPLLAQITTRMWNWDARNVYMRAGGSHYAASKDELDSYRRDHATEISRAVDMRGYARSCWLTPMLLGTVHIILRRVDENAANEFLEKLITGADLPYGSPVLALREKLRDMKENGYGPPDERRAWVFLAWNAWRDGKDLTRLQPPRGGSAKAPFTAKNYPHPY